MNVFKIICVLIFLKLIVFLYFHRPPFQWHEWENILSKIKRKFTFFTQEPFGHELPIVLKVDWIRVGMGIPISSTPDALSPTNRRDMLAKT